MSVHVVDAEQQHKQRRGKRNVWPKNKPYASYKSDSGERQKAPRRTQSSTMKDCGYIYPIFPKVQQAAGADVAAAASSLLLSPLRITCKVCGVVVL